jgi:hypothetical protein
MEAKTATEITQALTEIILEEMPDAALIEKYGGLIVERIAGEAKTQCCGFFVYTNHISLEFSRGVLLRDDTGHLEGAGKHRRHIKLTRLSEIKSKGCREYLEQIAKI